MLSCNIPPRRSIAFFIEFVPDGRQTEYRINEDGVLFVNVGRELLLDPHRVITRFDRVIDGDEVRAEIIETKPSNGAVAGNGKPARQKRLNAKPRCQVVLDENALLVVMNTDPQLTPQTLQCAAILTERYQSDRVLVVLDWDPMGIRQVNPTELDLPDSISLSQVLIGNKGLVEFWKIVGSFRKNVGQGGTSHARRGAVA